MFTLSDFFGVLACALAAGFGARIGYLAGDAVVDAVDRGWLKGKRRRWVRRKELDASTAESKKLREEIKGLRDEIEDLRNPKKVA